jgi:hypothetical protein
MVGCAGLRGSQALGLDSGQREKGFSESRSTREALDAAFEPRRVALVVGINDYDDDAFPSLKWAENDAKEVERILEDPRYGGFDRVISLTGAKQARRDRILSELISLRHDLRRQDTLVVFVSSHGTMTLDANGEPRLYLVTSDTRPGDLRGTAIELAELQRYFSDVRAERKALIIDACYNGRAKSTLQPTVRQRVARMEQTPVLSRKVRLGESEAHLFAATFGRAAREDDELQHGVYTYHLLESLTWSLGDADTNSDGVVTVYEAHDYARSKTISYTTGEQIPEAYFRVVGHNDLVLAGTLKNRKRADMSALFHYGPAGDDYDGAVLFIDGREKGTFPGTHHVPSGRHRIRIVGADGAVLQDRTISVSGYGSLAADSLVLRPATYNGFISLGARGRFGLTDSLATLSGRAHLGVDLSGGYRFMGPVDGLTVIAGFTWAPHRVRFGEGVTATFEDRHIFSGSAGIGYRLLLNRGMLGVGYRLRVQGLTTLESPQCGGHPACDAWLYGTHGMAFEQSLVLGRRWSLHVEEEVGVTGLDLGAGIAPAVDASIRLAIEVAL